MTSKEPLTNEHSSSEYVPKKDFSNHPENPFTDPELKHIFKNRQTNGFSEAFVKYSARGFLVHIPSLKNCLKAKRGA